MKKRHPSFQRFREHVLETRLTSKLRKVILLRSKIKRTGFRRYILSSDDILKYYNNFMVKRNEES